MRNRSFALLLALAGCAGTPPIPPPVASGELVAPCPDSPNCVSTAAPDTDAEHHAEPLAFTGTVDDAKARMKVLVATMPRTALVDETPTSLTFTFTSALMGFVDDVHMVFVAAPEVPAPGGPSTGRIEYRSASRVGHGDMGVNRARMADIATAWAAAGAPR